jgi:hypothetical protein
MPRLGMGHTLCMAYPLFEATAPNAPAEVATALGHLGNVESGTITYDLGSFKVFDKIVSRYSIARRCQLCSEE